MMLRILFALFASSILFSTVLFSAEYYSLGATGSGTEAMLIDEHGACHGVMNTTANVYFIPTKTAAEWSSFRAHPPTGVTVTTCCAKVC